MIKITSKRHNFRRCGIPHPKGAVAYPDDRFTADEMETLQAEPMLFVEIVPDEESDSGKIDPELLKVARGAIEDGSVTGDGRPTVDALAVILGRNVSAKERDAAWDQIKAEDDA